MSIFPGSRRTKVTGGRFQAINAAGSSNVVVNNNSSRAGSGFDRLEQAALPQALRDSSAREIPRCLKDTRVEHLRNITSWGKGEWKSRKARVLWMEGPAGVGKSAIAQTWADTLEEKFAAAFFFSRANHWNQPEKFWPTISYQLSTKYTSYRDVVDAAIIRDPFILSKSLDVQFQELLVKPLRELSSEDREAIQDAIIVIDGLDECSSQDAQRLIINVVTTSAATGTSSFLWGFFTRPEPYIISAFSSNRAPEVCWRLTLPVQSPDSDKDIRTYLRDGFEMIRAKYFLDSSWPSDTDFDRLAKQSDGLFAYSTNAIRFIDEGPGSPQVGPEERLQALFNMGQGSRAKLSKLDQLYLLIMDQIPKNTLSTTLLVLCSNQHLRGGNYSRSIPLLSSLLVLSQSGVLSTVRTLHSVLEVTSGEKYPSLRYYHASFTDFLITPERSTSEYCINTQDIFSRLYSASIDAACRPLPPMEMCHYNPTERLDTDQDKTIAAYYVATMVLVELPRTMARLRISNRPDPMKFKDINWSFLTKFSDMSYYSSQDEMEQFIHQIPVEWRPEIIYPFPETILARVKRKVLRRGSKRKGYILGTGANRVWLMWHGQNHYYFPVSPDGSNST